MTKQIQGSLDRLAIGVSTLCAFHCLLTPVAVVLFPVLASVLGSDETFHKGLVLFVVPSSIGALGLGCWRHRNRFVLGLGAVGVGTLLATLAVGHIEHWEVCLRCPGPDFSCLRTCVTTGCVVEAIAHTIRTVATMGSLG